MSDEDFYAVNFAAELLCLQDQSYTLTNDVVLLLYIKFDYYDTGIEAVNSRRPWNIIDLTCFKQRRSE